jgi:hypothetical protein
MKQLSDKCEHLVVVRLKPYLQEYLTCKFKKDFTGSMKNFVGASLRPLLAYVPENKTPVDYKKLPGYDPKYFIEIPLPHYKFICKKRHNIYLPPNHFHHFENIIYLLFWEVFFAYVDDKIRYNSQAKLAIYQFCIDYDITFNKMTYETLKKSYYRKRLKINPDLCAVKRSLTCP